MCKLCKYVRASLKYDMYCYKCFCYTFPEKEIIRNHKIKENQICQSIIDEFSYLEFRQDRMIIGGTSKRRPDLLLNCDLYNIIIEIDEHQHTHVQYGDGYEDLRLMEIYEDLNNKPLIVIRFNPDSYDNEPGLFSINKFTKKLQVYDESNYLNRMSILYNELMKYININPPIEKITIVKLFYNST